MLRSVGATGRRVARHPISTPGHFDQIPYAIPVDAPHGRTVGFEGTPSPASTSVPIRYWAVDFWSCCLHKPTFFMAWFLPCFPLAAIAQRTGWSSYWRVLLSLVLVFVVETGVRVVGDLPARQLWFVQLVSREEDNKPTKATNTTASVWELEFDKELDIEDPILRQIAANYVDLLLRTSLAAGVIIAVVTTVLRMRIRKIDDLFGSVLCDVLSSFFCNCCAISQMAAHFDSSKLLEPVDTLPAYRAT